MKIINIDSSDEDSFRYAILYSLHYYDISHNPQRISKPIPFQNKYNFSHNTPKEFETDNPNISVTVFNEDKKIIYSPNNFTPNKASIVKRHDNRYAPIKLLKDNFIKLKELLQSFPQSELRDLSIQNILRKYIDY